MALGEQAGFLALPLTAVLTLHASAAELGILTAAGRAPYLLLGLPIGVWIDRWRRKPVLVTAALAYAAVMATVPVAALLHLLTFGQLAGVALLGGTCDVFFDVAVLAYIPHLVGAARLVQANSMFGYVNAVGQAAGPSAGGALVQALTAPIAVAADALGSLLGGLLLLPIPADPAPSREGGRGILPEIKEGLEFVLTHPLLRPLALTTATANLFITGFFTLQLLFWVRVLGLQPALIGLILTLAGPGSLAGAMLASRLSRRLGAGVVALIGALLFSCTPLLVPWLQRGADYVVPVLLLAALAGPCGGALYNVVQLSLRQAVTPARLQGRMNASVRFLVWGTMPIGGALGGAVGQAYGLRPALWFFAAAGVTTVCWLLFSPVRRLREQPSA